MGVPGHGMSHRTAVAVMVVVTLLWSMAGIVTRQIEHAQGLELTFWRSLFNAGALTAILGWHMGWRSLRHALLGSGWLVWASGVCWGVMFTAFMAALTLTTVANVLITMALAPLFTAVLGRMAFGDRLAGHTVAAVLMAGIGLVGMQLPGLMGAEFTTQAQWGMGLALAVPLGGAVNWILIKQASRSAGGGVSKGQVDLLPAVWVGAVLSALGTAGAAWPFQASQQDLSWLALLGVFQLAVPCLLAVQAARYLSPTEVSLLSLLEVVFGVAWAWWGTAEVPQPAVLAGGGLVLAALVFNEGWSRRIAS